MRLMEEYRASHRHPLNRLTHSIGIPLIVGSLLLAFFHWKIALVLFCIGWCFQFAGHLIEGNRPAFFKSPMHLLIGPYWWITRFFR